MQDAHTVCACTRQGGQILISRHDRAEAPGDRLQSHFHSVFLSINTLKMKNSAIGSLN